MAKPILISGIQPTGRLHLGNYLGALKNFVELQNSEKYECYFFIADYHSLTINFNPKEKTGQVLRVANDYLAAGINPKKSTIFIQSQISEITELAWILNTITPIGELRRMTQFKEKKAFHFNDPLREKLVGEFSKKIKEGGASQGEIGIFLVKLLDATVNYYESGEGMNVGLLNYPVLMAADILLYDAKFVPVGEDQLQHLELTRTLARKFNKKFGETFIEPQAIMTKTPRVMSLDNPQKKMSKTSPSGCLFLDDSPKEIKDKIKRAITDSGAEIKYDPKNKPGVSNLLLIYEALSGDSVQNLEKKYAGKGYSEFKDALAQIISDSLKPFRASQTADSKLKNILSDNAEKIRGIAAAKMMGIKKKLGLISL